MFAVLGLINKCISCLFVTGIIKMSSTVGGGVSADDQKSSFNLGFTAAAEQFLTETRSTPSSRRV